jgi:hypothetical protein
MRPSYYKPLAEVWNLMLFSGGAELIDKGNADGCRQNAPQLGRTKLGQVSWFLGTYSCRLHETHLT